ncbi:tRNA pseudouridine synthase B [Jatrophihabitans sp. GAS493]|uniref:tRNA pseudouridine(55) synthase TruB n=1 Tax=Jatrophihabitans sp. GAS493 TaxID=1907575 RepID=UPI000BBF5D31|nr:tRNA pseudouridine(55) synthase TruB [Jatrophihabitans sp. GAS493]SOD74162.1 tRNA pseudouridine synthase B [Jatrophihabitans sp. GAS493]
MATEIGRSMAKRDSDATSGLVIVDKDSDCTSHDVVARMRKLAHTRRVGHAGTLDPMATGVLVLGIEKATRLLHHLVLADKAYTATIRLGESTITDDAQGELLDRGDASRVSEVDVEAALAPLRGDIMQAPSAVSAIKVNGERAYKRVRDGEAVELPVRPVTVSRFTALSYTRPAGHLLDVQVEVECSSGTYIRALARDLGRALGVGGHLTALRRTRVGPFTLDDAQTLAELAELADPVTLPLRQAVELAFPVRPITEQQATTLTYGQSIEPAGIEGTYAVTAPDDTVSGLLREMKGRAQPVLVFNARG